MAHAHNRRWKYVFILLKGESLFFLTRILEEFAVQTKERLREEKIFFKSPFKWRVGPLPISM